MKRCLVLACFLSALLSLRAEIEFAGFFTIGKDTRFSLSDSDSRKSSGWLRLNDSFQGSTIVSFDPAREVLSLKTGEQVRELPLRTAKVKNGQTTISGVIDLGMGQSINNVRASLYLGEESSFPVSETMTFYLKPEVLPDGNLVYRARFVRRGPDGKNETITAPSVMVVPGMPFGIQVGQMGYSFTPEKIAPK